MSDKKPDQVVFNEETNIYDASLKPYPTNLGAPAIKITDTVAWKHSNAKKANEQLRSSFDELKIKYNNLVEKMELNELVYNAKFSFEPIVGNVYHLYRNKDEVAFLSILSPDECQFDHMGSFRLTSEKLWEAITDRG